MTIYHTNAFRHVALALFFFLMVSGRGQTSTSTTHGEKGKEKTLATDKSRLQKQPKSNSKSEAGKASGTTTAPAPTGSVAKKSSISEQADLKKTKESSKKSDDVRKVGAPKVESRSSQLKGIKGEGVKSVKSKPTHPTLKEIILIFELIGKERPELLGKIKPETQKEMINKLLDSLGGEIRYNLTMTPEDKKNVNSACFPPVLIKANHILYARLDNFSNTVLKNLEERCSMIAGMRDQPFGVVLDLRNCDNYDYQSAMKVASIFASEKKLRPFLGENKEKRLFKLPIMVLVGGKTKGAPEILAWVLKDTGSGMPIGEKTFGEPYEVEKHPLKTGGEIVLPKIPKEFHKIKPLPLQPSIKEKSYPMLSYEDFSKNADAIEKDLCLAKAAELIISLNALNGKSKYDSSIFGRKKDK